MADPLRIRQGVWVLVAVGLLVAAGGVQVVLDRMAVRDELFIEANVGSEKSLVAIMPGGLRAIAFSYVWQRSQMQHEAGRHYDAREMADLACRLMPNFPGVWSFHAWNMAWNISVTTHTPEERWHWVTQGLELLRDEAIPRNRKSLLLYKEMGWIFFSKMGQSLDEMHPQYKRYWAAEMQRLLGSTSYGTTDEVIEAFRPIAEAPLDKSLDRQGRTIPGTLRREKEVIQADQLKILLSDPVIAAYAEALSQYDILVDDSLLAAYNRFSNDLAARDVRLFPPTMSDDREQAIFDLINDPETMEPRGKLLAFVRAQILWNVYRMDPDWMLGLMEKYHAPLDWRLPEPHGVYWITYGTHVSEDLGLDSITAINTDRVALFCLKTLTRRGRLVYMENPDDPDQPILRTLFDLRYIAPTQQEYIETIEAELGPDGPVKDSMFRVGHENYMIDVVQMLFAADRRVEAAEYLNWVKERYEPVDMKWHMGLEDFVVATLHEEGAINYEIAGTLVQVAMQTALEGLAVGDEETYEASYDFAYDSIYKHYQSAAGGNVRLSPWQYIVYDIAAEMIIRPQNQGLNLDLADRSLLYDQLDSIIENLRAEMYDSLLNSPLPAECEAAGVDFFEAFPEPPGLDAVRERRRAATEQMVGTPE
jgi:hypothetical protein